MKTAYKYFKKLNLDDEWTEITPGEMEDFIDMKFEAAPRTDWTGNTLPSRAEAWNRLHEGQTIYTYTSAYKSEPIQEQPEETYRRPECDGCKKDCSAPGDRCPTHDELMREYLRDTQPIFLAITPTGITFADRTREEHGDYKKVAHLFWDDLTIRFYDAEAPTDLLNQIINITTTYQMRAGEQQQISAAGQFVTLGHAMSEEEREKLRDLAATVYALSKMN